MNIPNLTHRYLPPSGPAKKLLVVMHGRGDSMEGFQFLPGALDLPGYAYLFLNAPDDWYGGYSWYDMAPHQGPGVLRSRALLFEVLDALRDQGVRSEDIVLFGFSQGCLMAIDVGLRYPHPLGGICGISGYMMFEDRVQAEATPAAFEASWLLTHGTHDGVLPIETTRRHVAALQAAGLPVDWHEFHKDHTIDPMAELPLIRRWLSDRA